MTFDFMDIMDFRLALVALFPDNNYMLDLNTAVGEIPHCGPITAKKLQALDIEYISDLLFHFPFRYDDYSKLTAIKELQTGMNANVAGTVELIENKKSPRKRIYITECLISDETGMLKVIWFNQPFIAKSLQPGDRVSLAGRVDEDFSGLFLNSPLHEKLSTTGQPTSLGLLPNYHLTSTLTQKQLRSFIKQIINQANFVPDWLPGDIQTKLQLLSLKDAIKKIHFPKDQTDITTAQRRLAFNELFLIQAQAQLTRQAMEHRLAAPIKFLESETKNFVAHLPFKLTDAQRRASWEILQDIAKEKPMLRLLEGDVGSGKTVVALLAMFNVVLNHKKAVLMAPTEILAQQHYESISKLLTATNIKVGLITSGSKKLNITVNSKTKKLDAPTIIEHADIIIGTHALIQEKISIPDLALAVVDEQHRFGVEQRQTLIAKNSQSAPHLLSMTATPIPRSLALALYGDLDISIINEMPVGRKKITTQIITENHRPQIYQFIKQRITAGEQVFVVCPLIDPSDELGVKSTKEEFEKLDKIIFPHLKIAMIHGKMKTKEKETIMADFQANKINILVATSVIEVGVDIPNATIMLIEGADRFGLAQLHQFRGRIGRSDQQSYCFVCTDNNNPNTLTRLQALCQYHDGFELAKIDLKFRGPGEVYSKLQKGFPELKIASLFDYQLMQEAKEAAQNLLNKNPDLNGLSGLKEKIDDLKIVSHLE